MAKKKLITSARATGRAQKSLLDYCRQNRRNSHPNIDWLVAASPPSLFNGFIKKPA